MKWHLKVENDQIVQTHEFEQPSGFADGLRLLIELAGRIRKVKPIIRAELTRAEPEPPRHD